MQKQPVKQQNNFARCWNCKGVFTKDQLKVEEREAGRDYEIGIHCPDCKAWTHYFFLNNELKKLIEVRTRPGMNNRKTRRTYETLFRKFNNKKRRREGMKKINGRWVKPERATV